jgi:hypothetical protein
MKKSRFFLLHSTCNPSKAAALEALHAEYVCYVRVCVQTMLDARRLTLPRSAKQDFFPAIGGAHAGWTPDGNLL